MATATHARHGSKASDRPGSKASDRPGSKAHARMVRMSASKARVVLNLVRGKHVNEAKEILSFSERLASDVIGKCLASAVANAEHNDDLDADELFVSACYADQGPTLKRFRPRARGRAGRIHKQTCHITVEVSRYSEDELDQLRKRDELKNEGRQSRSKKSDGGGDRARRVAKSRAAAGDEAPEVEEPTDEVAEDLTDDAVTEDVTDGADPAEQESTDEVAEDLTDDAVTEAGATEVANATSSDNEPLGEAGATDEVVSEAEATEVANATSSDNEPLGEAGAAEGANATSSDNEPLGEAGAADDDDSGVK